MIGGVDDRIDVLLGDVALHERHSHVWWHLRTWPSCCGLFAVVDPIVGVHPTPPVPRRGDTTRRGAPVGPFRCLPSGNASKCLLLNVGPDGPVGAGCCRDCCVGQRQSSGRGLRFTAHWIPIPGPVRRRSASVVPVRRTAASPPSPRMTMFCSPTGQCEEQISERPNLASFLRGGRTDRVDDDVVLGTKGVGDPTARSRFSSSSRWWTRLDVYTRSNVSTPKSSVQMSPGCGGRPCRPSLPFPAKARRSSPPPEGPKRLSGDSWRRQSTTEW